MVARSESIDHRDEESVFVPEAEKLEWVYETADKIDST